MAKLRDIVITCLSLLLWVVGILSCTKLSDLVPRSKPQDDGDTTPPTVRILSPTNGETFFQNTVTIKISVTDNKSGIKRVYLKLNDQPFEEITGNEANSGITNREYHYPIAASEGTNMVYVYAVDNAGNKSPKVSVFFIVTTRPYLMIISPPNWSVFETDQISVSGRAFGHYRISTVFLRVGENGNFGVVNGTEQWSTNLIFDTEGVHRVYAFAVDVSNRVSETNHINLIVVLNNIYVSVTGNDTNTGLSKNLPVKTIQVGLQRAYEYQKTNILVQAGTYLPGSGLNPEINGVIITNSNLKLIGGLNEDFSRITGYSILDGRRKLYHIVFASNANNVLLLNFLVMNGSATNTDDTTHTKGGGIFLMDTTSFEIENTIVSNNISIGEGAGIYMQNAHNSRINAELLNNSITPFTNEDFGILHINNSTGVFQVNVSSNTGRGISWIGHTHFLNLLINSVISHNNGGGLFVRCGPLEASNIKIYNNIASRGAGIDIADSLFTILDSVITNNKGTNVNSSIQIYGYLMANGGGVTFENISRCYIGGDGTTNSIGIDQIGWKPPNVLRGNKFIANTLQYLYKKMGELTNDINAINDPSYFSYFCDTGDNIVTNM